MSLAWDIRIECKASLALEDGVVIALVVVVVVGIPGLLGVVRGGVYVL
jgi:hypothetical protein